MNCRDRTQVWCLAQQIILPEPMSKFYFCFNFLRLILFRCMCLCVHVYMQVSTQSWRRMSSPGAGVPGTCQLPSVVAEIWTLWSQNWAINTCSHWAIFLSPNLKKKKKALTTILYFSLISQERKTPVLELAFITAVFSLHRWKGTWKAELWLMKYTAITSYS